MPTAHSISPDEHAMLLRAYARNNEPVPQEVNATLELVYGELPTQLTGTHFRNGPGKQEAYGVPYDHPFDGDGMILRFAFDGERVRYRNRYVRTREFLAEERAQRMLYRGFGTNLPGGLLANGLRARFKNAANTSVVYHAGRLLALWEGGLPHEIDPDSLATLSRFDFDGALLPDAPLERLLMPELPFSAHPTEDPRTGELFNFGTMYGVESSLLVYTIAPEGHVMDMRRIGLDRMSFVHDFVLTEHYLAFALTPVVFDVPRALAGLSTPVASLSRDPDAPTTILLAPRGGGEPLRFHAPGGFIFHYVNGFDEDGGQRVVLDGCWMDDLPSADVAKQAMRGAAVAFEGASLVRMTVDVRAQQVSLRDLASTTLELPSVHPGYVMRRHRYAYGISHAPGRRGSLMTAIARVDVEREHATHRDFFPDLPGEPLFVAHPGRDDESEGWLLSLVYRSAEHISDLEILDARTLETVACVRLPHHVPQGFHSIFV
ncbi:MAG: carotenoid oxygenase family protein [Myxococcota bacterium]